jgi:UDP-N-acetylglucosamine 2-epimerase (non-hydrolysing)
MTDLLIVVGARPNFMKAASVAHAAQRAGVSYALVHTGQHYDDDLSRVFFDDLGLPEPDVFLGVGSGSHAAQTARIMLEFEEVLFRINPTIVVVVGDVNSTLACALVAAKEHYRVAHVEAGLRCYEPWMPEEINRRLCDHVAGVLFTTSRDASENLTAEGIAEDKICFVGNTMIDTILRFRDIAVERGTAAHFGLDGGPYAVLTMHRPENVDDHETIVRILEAIIHISRRIPVVFPIHPRTRKQLAASQIDAVVGSEPGLLLSSPIGYLDFVGLTASAAIVLTDSGGLQEETTMLGVPCLTLRESTERPVTVTHGTNRVVGSDPRRIVEEAFAVLDGERPEATVPELWDGRAGERIVERLRAEIVATRGLATLFESQAAEPAEPPTREVASGGHDACVSRPD